MKIAKRLPYPVFPFSVFVVTLFSMVFFNATPISADPNTPSNLNMRDIVSAPIPPELQELFSEDVSSPGSAVAPLIQPVVFNVLYKADGTGYVPYRSLVQQIAQLNEAFSGAEAKKRGYGKASDSGIRFTLHAVQYVQNDEWWTLCALPSTMSVMRPRVAVDPARYYNVYVCNVEGNLGLSWLPYSEWFRTGIPAENSWVLGSSVHWSLVSGMGGTDKYFKGHWNQGNILTHETGHHYGLMHPYQDDCVASQPSDGISDTPRITGNPIGTCRQYAGRNSCPRLPGKDDMSNYMMATDDSCRSHFTPGQIAFMTATINQYKPTLKKQLPVGCVSAVDTSDKSPDLLPCLNTPSKAALPGTTGPAPKLWCQTSKTNPSQWGWACCPAADGSPNGEGGCRLGVPTF